MLNVSSAFRQQLANDNSNFICSATITLTNGDTILIDNEDIWEDGVSIDDAVSDSNSFKVGAAIINQLTLVLDNTEEQFSDFEFDQARVVVNVGLNLPGGTLEQVCKGTFWVNGLPQYSESCITLTCYDAMGKLDVPYSRSTLTYPATLGRIAQDVCSVCGVMLNTTVFDHSTFVIDKRPEDDALTCRDVLSCVAQIAGLWARADVNGRICLKWYDLTTYEGPDIEGEILQDTMRDPILDPQDDFITLTHAGGVNGYKWNISDAKADKYHHIDAWSALNMSTNDVIITGVKVSPSDTGDSTAVLYGEEGYVLEISNNDLILPEACQSIATMLGQKLVGFMIRAYTGSCLSDPTIEAGDLVWITDRHRNYKTIITGTSFHTHSYQRIECGAESPSDRAATTYSAATRAAVVARRATKRQFDQFEIQSDNISSLISQGFGLYFSKELQPNGGYIYYLHDKPLLEESDFACKLTSNGIVSSRDGGTTWAIDTNGNALYNTLYARGVSADWINTGDLTVGGLRGNTNGSIIILDSAGHEIGRINKSGAQLQGGFTAYDPNTGHAMTIDEGAVFWDDGKNTISDHGFNNHSGGLITYAEEDTPDPNAAPDPYAEPTETEYVELRAAEVLRIAAGTGIEILSHITTGLVVDKDIHGGGIYGSSLHAANAWSGTIRVGTKTLYFEDGILTDVISD